MKSKFIFWCTFVTMLLLCLPVTALAADNPVGVAYRGHIQDLGDYPADGSWVDSPTIIGTEGQSKRIEGFEIKLTGTIPANLQNDLELRYNVHVQNKGWLYDENDTTNWPKDSNYAGTRGESLRIEATKIVLTDSDGKPVSGFSVQYRGHVQNVGDLPADESQWIADGDQLGTVGSSLRLEALLVKVVKNQTDLTAYQALLTAIGKTVESDYTAASWETLQKALTDNAETANNNQTEVDKATTAIQKAYDGLVKKAAAVVYDKAGTYGPETGTEVINGDVIVKADGITLRNLHINGDLYVGAEQVAAKTEENTAETTNASQVVVNNTDYNTIIQNLYIAYFTRLAAGTHLTITGSQPQAFAFFLPGGTQFTVTTPGGGIGTGAPMQITAGASGGPAGGISVGGTIGSLSLLTPGTQVSLAPGSQVQQLSVQTGASNCGVISSSTALIQNLVVQGPGATFTGSGTIQNVVVQGTGATFAGSGMIQHADIQADGASFATRPGDFTVAPGVATPPSMPAPPSGGGGYYAPTQSQPVISSTGAVAFPATVTISSQGADCICYTTNGSDPMMATGAQDTILIIGETASITIDHDMTVKAMAVRAGYYNSTITSATFTQAASADLTGIALSPAVGNFNFSANTYNYPNVTVPYDTPSITITPSGSGSITVNGTPVDSGTELATPVPVSFQVETTITIVNQEPGKTPKTYTIKVTPSSGTVTPLVSTIKTAFTATATSLDVNTSGIFDIKPGTSGVLSKVEFASADESIIASGTVADGKIPILKDGTVTLLFKKASVTLLQSGTTYDKISLPNVEITIISTAYLAKVNTGTGTVDDYDKAGITGVVADNLSGINQAVTAARNAANGTELDKDTIQNLVDL
ncbi:MAG: cadherin-like beta sandwich domain-containing protein [Acetobacterium woodii]|nr:cadherin-like beta sandwich domain-containing protein [Acetobacterium woodii]